MDDRHIKILNWFNKELLLSLNVQSLLAPLRKNKLITSLEEKNLEKFAEDDLISETTKAAAIFLQILKKKGPDAFGIFVNVLGNEREHLGHKSLYSKLVKHKHGNLPRCESEPADLPGEKLILSTPIRHNSLKNTTLAGAIGTNIGRIVEEGGTVETRLEQICKSLKSLEEKIDSFTPQFAIGEQHSPYGADSVDKRHRNSEIAGLPSLQPALFKIPFLTAYICFMAAILVVIIVLVPMDKLCGKLQASQVDQSTPLDAHRLPLTLGTIEITCSFKNLQMMPLAFDYKMHFVPQLSTDVNPHQQVEILDLQEGVIVEKAQSNATTKINASLCPTMLNYLGKITIFGKNSKTTGLFSLDSSMKSWVLVDSSDFSFKNVDFENCVCCIHSSDNVVVVTGLQSIIYFYLFSPIKQNNTYWKSAKLSLPQQISDCHVQSCVVISKTLFCSLLTSTHLIIYQADLSKLYKSTNDTCFLEPTKSWILENFNLKNCFLSSLNEDIVTIMVKKTGNLKVFVEFSELKHFNSGSFEPIISFSSVTEVIYATVIPDSTNLGVVYFDSNVYKMCLLNVFSKTQDVNGLFASFLSKYIQVVEKADFSKIAEILGSLSHGVPKDIEEKILQAKDCVSFINALKPAHCNWLNVSILKEVAQDVDIEATQLISQFIETIYPRKVKEVMWHISQFSMDNYTEVKETWNMDLHDLIIEDLFNHQELLASLLQIQQHSLTLQKVEPGIEIYWVIPTRLVDQARQSAKEINIENYYIMMLEIDGQKIASVDQYHHPVTEELSAEAEPVSETVRPPAVTCKEWEIQKQNYAKLISTLTDIDGLLPHFVESDIIGYQEERDILAQKTQSDRVRSLLSHILGPLEGGDTKGFYKLLDIMKSKGKQATKDLAKNMEDSLNG